MVAEAAARLPIDGKRPMRVRRTAASVIEASKSTVAATAAAAEEVVKLDLLPILVMVPSACTTREASLEATGAAPGEEGSRSRGGGDGGLFSSPDADFGVRGRARSVSMRARITSRWLRNSSWTQEQHRAPPGTTGLAGSESSAESDAHTNSEVANAPTSLDAWEALRPPAPATPGTQPFPVDALRAWKKK
eukprot:TRINITY_DN73253_c0_g1_i1.p2 TRINITY_DN73253_c0_g1~~TRINITY_DN73253_c0_g1_i1.p2  ORF type:complete len:203 (-),score=31.79 TRINITY_DN73253_c0_g1_i1:46-618(-)